jgi:hypothetical protein
VNWDQYLPQSINNLIGGHGHELMLAVGVIEIVAGIGVAFKPKFFAYVVAAWLLLIIVNLLMIPGYFDISNIDWYPIKARLKRGAIPRSVAGCLERIIMRENLNTLPQSDQSSTHSIMDYTTVPVGLPIQGHIWTGQATTTSS